MKAIFRITTFFLIFLKHIVKNYNNQINKYYLIEKNYLPISIE